MYYFYHRSSFLVCNDTQLYVLFFKKFKQLFADGVFIVGDQYIDRIQICKSVNRAFADFFAFNDQNDLGGTTHQFAGDVAFLGAGAVGTVITRELTKYNLDVICVDKREDVGSDCSKSNSAIIHTGYDAKPGTLESELVVSANPQYPKLCKDLNIPFEMIGAILPASPRNSLHSFPVLKKSV